MKFAIVVPDGAADHPIEALGGRTPLEAARTPHMDRVARDGALGLARTIPDGMKPGSDVGHLSLLGYDPVRYRTGRAPIEAAAMGLRLAPEAAAFRMNLVTVAPDGTMLDYSAGHITTEEARDLVGALAGALGSPAFEIVPGVQYRHILHWKEWGSARPFPELTPPHDIAGQPAARYLPSGPERVRADLFRDLMERSKPVLAAHPVNAARRAAGQREATQIWLWGAGRAPSIPRFRDRYGLSGAAISAVDIVRGLAALAGLDLVTVPGATGYYDTDYAAKGRYAVRALEDHDLVYVHVEAPDEATHEGLLEKKVEAIERIDADIVGPLRAALEQGFPGDYRLLVVPDHATTLASRTHVADPIPFALAGKGVPASGSAGYTEKCASQAQGITTITSAHDLMRWTIVGPA